MKKLYIVGSPRGERSKSNDLAQYTDSIIDGETVVFDTFKDFNPFLTEGVIAYTYGFAQYENLSAEDKKVVDTQKKLIEDLLSADVLIISAPMWNFGMPASLKAWFDLIIKVNTTFSMENGNYKGLVNNIKKAVVVGARGAVYNGTPMESYDLLAPQIKTMLGFMGITNAETFWIEGVNADASKVEENMKNLKNQIAEFVK